MMDLPPTYLAQQRGERVTHRVADPEAGDGERDPGHMRCQHELGARLEVAEVLHQHGKPRGLARPETRPPPQPTLHTGNTQPQSTKLGGKGGRMGSDGAPPARSSPWRWSPSTCSVT
jgi:hypothetical protein